MVKSKLRIWSNKQNKMIRFIASIFLVIGVSNMVDAWTRKFRFSIPSTRFRPNPPRAPAHPPTKATTPAAAFNPVKDSRYCDESEITKLLSGRKRREVSKRRC